MRSWQLVELTTSGLADADLAGNVPGQQARSRAADEWTRVRSRRPFRAVLARTFNLPTEERSRREGAESEEAVGNRLNRLTDRGWFVLHSVPLGRGEDIDHLVIGPGGVFAVDTKAVPNTRIRVQRDVIEVAGQRTDFIERTRRAAAHAHDVIEERSGISVPVSPVLVLVTGQLFGDVAVIEPPAGVAVLDRLQVPRWFVKRPPALTDQNVLGLYECARLASTWR